MASQDFSKIDIIFFLTVLVAGVATMVYRSQLHSDADPLIKQSCESQPMATGAYARCLMQGQAAP